MQQKNKEGEQWKAKMQMMQGEHQDVIDSLKEANKSYLTQVGENEDLRKQLSMMQEQHISMMRKFEDIETRLMVQPKKEEISPVKTQIVQAEKMDQINDLFHS